MAKRDNVQGAVPASAEQLGRQIDAHLIEKVRRVLQLSSQTVELELAADAVRTHPPDTISEGSNASAGDNGS